jgi:hypothetical protein
MPLCVLYLHDKGKRIDPFAIHRGAVRKLWPCEQFRAW